MAALLLLLAGAWYGLHFIPVDRIYGVEAEFASVPPDDNALEASVAAQPGVWTVLVERNEAGPRTRVTVVIGMTRNRWGYPPFPDLDGKCAELGYRNPLAPFHDREPR